MTGEIGYQVMVGGGLGRTPFIGKVIRDFLPHADLLAYLEAIMRVYNRYGRRDNKYKARIKILVHEMGIDEIPRRGRSRIRDDGPLGSSPTIRTRFERIAAYFAPPPYESLPARSATTLRAAKLATRSGFRQFRSTQRRARTRAPGYAIVTVSLKPIGGIPGDATLGQMRRAGRR